MGRAVVVWLVGIPATALATWVREDDMILTSLPALTCKTKPPAPPPPPSIAVQHSSQLRSGCRTTRGACRPCRLRTPSGTRHTAALQVWKVLNWITGHWPSHCSVEDGGCRTLQDLQAQVGDSLPRTSWSLGTARSGWPCSCPSGRRRGGRS